MSIFEEQQAKTKFKVGDSIFVPVSKSKCSGGSE